MLYLALFIGTMLLVVTTKLTQFLKLSGIWVLLGQISASLIIIMVGNLEISYIKQIELGYITIPFSLLFLIGFTNVMNMEKEQTPLILLLPCVSFVSLSISAFIMGYSFVSITGIWASLIIMFVLLYSYFSGKVFVGRTLTTSIGFIIAVLSLALFKTSVVTMYIPVFTLALPFALYYLIQNKFTTVQSITISSLMAVFFSVLMFVVPFNTLWYLIVGLTVLLVIMQLSRRYRFI
ncbi:UDP-N-acetylmuramyl pentapeptide phosphotransferase [Bacillus seohaeanensis]|uniref:UDP-N-acetylmuramyl pentapeptide phosphotransferase n=1 Tax=Bacillus seohaeanensis TaxID=284580 RepID=A0ABW5RTY2_9BACI